MEDMDILSSLEKIGLNGKEALLYLHALQLGTFSVLDIAKASGLKRPTCYLILDELLKKGLVAKTPKVKKVSYIVSQPDALVRHAESQAMLAQRIFPSLMSVMQFANDQPRISFYSGQRGIRNIYNDILRSSIKEYFYIGSSSDLVEMAGKEFLDEWIKKRVSKNIKAKSIRIRSREVRSFLYQEQKGALREIRYAPENMVIPSTILMYGNKVGIITTKAHAFGFIVDNEEFVLSMKMLFETLWRISEKK